MPGAATRKKLSTMARATDKARLAAGVPAAEWLAAACRLSALMRWQW